MKTNEKSNGDNKVYIKGPVVAEVGSLQYDNEANVRAAIAHILDLRLTEIGADPTRYIDAYYRNLGPGGPDEWLNHEERATAIDSDFAKRDQILSDAPQLFIETVMPHGSVRHKVADTSLRDMVEIRTIDKPTGIICVPFAVLAESDDTTNAFFESLSKQDGIEDTEIFLYANYILNEQDDKDRSSAVDRLNELLASLGDRFPSLHLRATLREYQRDQLAHASMHRIRSDMMDVVVLDTQERGLSASTPVLWLDADTVKMQRQAVSTVLTEVGKGDVPFVHANLRSTNVSHRAYQKIEIENPNGLSVVNELIKRQEFRSGAYDQVIEENGFGFSIGTYALSGGVSVGGEALSETATVAWGLVGTMDHMIPTRYNDELCEQSIPSVTVMEAMYPGIVSGNGELWNVPSARLYALDRRRLDKLSNGRFDEIEGYGHSQFMDESYRSGVDLRKIGADIAARLIKEWMDDSELSDDEKQRILKRIM